MRIWLWALLFFPSISFALECGDVRYEGQDYSLCRVKFSDDHLALYLNDSKGDKFGSIANLRTYLESEGRVVLMAMNAGMYHETGEPVGLYQSENEERSPIVLNEGPGNFGLLPNGVFCQTAENWVVMESRQFDNAKPECTFATQSGPMLVINNALHPRFLPQSDSRYVRNGVGVSADGSEAILAISQKPVTFYEFGNLFLEKLETPNALYLDGAISQFYVKDGRRQGWPFALGPILAVTIATEDTQD